MTARADPLLDCAGVGAEQLREVLRLVDNTDITELDVTIGATRLSLRRSAGAVRSEPTRTTDQVADTLPLAIASPLVGIFRPAASVGDEVRQGQSIGAIEALGMPTSVDAPHSGTVETVLVQDGSPVEYGQPLLVLRRAP